MNCNRCGNPLAPHDATCARCGAPGVGSVLPVHDAGPPMAAASGSDGMSGFAGPYAGFWIRSVAVLIDSVIVFVAMFVIAFSVAMLSGGIGGGGEALLNVAGLVAGWLYWTLSESGPHQATLGKRAVGIRVASPDGARISFARATGRYFAKFVSGIILGIGYLMAAFTKKSRRFTT